MYDVFWRTFGNSSYLEKTFEDGRYRGINVTVLEPSPETGMFDPLGMLNAHPSKSKRFLWQGYRDTGDTLEGGKPRSGRAKGVVPGERPRAAPTSPGAGGSRSRKGRSSADGRRSGGGRPAGRAPRTAR